MRFDFRFYEFFVFRVTRVGTLCGNVIKKRKPSPRRDSNPGLRLRHPAVSPLSYEGGFLILVIMEWLKTICTKFQSLFLGHSKNKQSLY